MTDEELEDRLKNWGRWTMDRKGYRYAYSDEQDVKRKRPKPIINVNDALLVMRCWQKMPTSQYDLRRARLLLGVYYCFFGSLNTKLQYIRKMYKYRILVREVEDLLFLAKKIIRNLIRQQDNRSKNRNIGNA